MRQKASGHTHPSILSMRQAIISPTSFQDGQHNYFEKTTRKSWLHNPKKLQIHCFAQHFSKALESIMAKKITYLADKFQLLPEMQMGAH